MLKTHIYIIATLILVKFGSYAYCEAPMKQIKRSNGSTIEQLELALLGDKAAVGNLLFEKPGDTPISSTILKYLGYQNGDSMMEEFAASDLFRTTNPFNRIRATYLFGKTKHSNEIDRIWGNWTTGREPGWKIYFDKNKQSKLLNDFIKSTIVDKNEINILCDNAIPALHGDRRASFVLWKYYFSKIKPEWQNAIWCPWLEQIHVAEDGFPGTTTINKYIYWLNISAENGDPEAQYELANILGLNDKYSKDRALFWLKKSAMGGDKRAVEALNRLH